MGEPFIGSEAVAAGDVVASALRHRYQRVFRDVYVVSGTELTPLTRGRAGWLWSRRRGVVAGFTASAIHGARWVDDSRPIELIHDNRHRLPGLLVRGDEVSPDEVMAIRGVPVTTPERTAFDLCCWYPIATAVPAVDALARATGIKPPDVELIAARYPGRRGSRSARRALQLVDAGAESPKESWLRLLLVDAQLPPLETQVPVFDRRGRLVARVDMGWPDLKIAIEYDGEQHRSDERQYAWDITRSELLVEAGWIVIRITAKDRPGDIIRRVRAALARRA
jgi:very-short-patch-repair endonuclease